MTESELERIIDEVDSKALIASSQEASDSYTFQLQGKRREWNVKLNFFRRFPYQLPQAVLLDHEVIGKIPHVNRAGVICFEEGDTLLVDHSKPVQIISCMLEQLAQMLDRFSLAIYQDELLDEFEGYFLAPNKSNSVNSFYHAGDTVEQPCIRLKKLSNKRHQGAIRPVLIEPVGTSVPEAFGIAGKNGDLTANKIIHLALERPVLPPENAEQNKCRIMLPAFLQSLLK